MKSRVVAVITAATLATGIGVVRASPASAGGMCWQSSYYSLVTIPPGASTYRFFGWTPGAAIVAGGYNQDQALGLSNAGALSLWTLWNSASGTETVGVQNHSSFNAVSAGWFTSVIGC